MLMWIKKYCPWTPACIVSGSLPVRRTLVSCLSRCILSTSMTTTCMPASSPSACLPPCSSIITLSARCRTACVPPVQTTERRLLSPRLSVSIPSRLTLTVCLPDCSLFLLPACVLVAILHCQQWPTTHDLDQILVLQPKMSPTGGCCSKLGIIKASPYTFPLLLYIPVFVKCLVSFVSFFLSPFYYFPCSISVFLPNTIFPAQYCFLPVCLSMIYEFKKRSSM